MIIGVLYTTIIPVTLLIIGESSLLIHKFRCSQIYKKYESIIDNNILYQAKNSHKAISVYFIKPTDEGSIIQSELLYGYDRFMYWTEIKSKYGKTLDKYLKEHNKIKQISINQEEYEEMSRKARLYDEASKELDVAETFLRG